MEKRTHEILDNIGMAVLILLACGFTYKMGEVFSLADFSKSLDNQYQLGVGAGRDEANKYWSEAISDLSMDSLAHIEYPWPIKSLKTRRRIVFRILSIESVYTR